MSHSCTHDECMSDPAFGVEWVSSVWVLKNRLVNGELYLAALLHKLTIGTQDILVPLVLLSLIQYSCKFKMSKKSVFLLIELTTNSLPHLLIHTNIPNVRIIRHPQKQPLYRFLQGCSSTWLSLGVAGWSSIEGSARFQSCGLWHLTRICWFRELVSTPSGGQHQVEVW